MADESQEKQFITPDECYEYFEKIIREQRPVTPVELIAQAYLGVLLYHVGRQMTILSMLMNDLSQEPTDGNGQTEGDAE